MPEILKGVYFSPLLKFDLQISWCKIIYLQKASDQQLNMLWRWRDSRSP